MADSSAPPGGRFVFSVSERVLPYAPIGLADNRPDVVTGGEGDPQRCHDEWMQEAANGTDGGTPDAP